MFSGFRSRCTMPRVARPEPARDLRGDGDGLRQRRRPLAQQLTQRLSVEQFGDSVVHTVLAAEVVDREDVGM